MYIEIKGVNFKNKGAELMLHSILQQIRKNRPEAKIVVSAIGMPYEKRAFLGLYQKFELRKFSFDFGAHFGSFLPRRLLEMFGIVLEKDIDVLLDASGLAYSDQWGYSATKHSSVQFKRMKKNGTKIYLLPQAIGPLKSIEIKKYFKQIINNADLIYARDSVSYQYCLELVNNTDIIKQSPDFTNLVEIEKSSYFNPNKEYICLIPNYRMIDMTNNKDSYLNLMKMVVSNFSKRQEKLFWLLHEGDKDLWLAEEINKLTGNNIRIVNENNPLKIKWIIGASKAVISSRFHGLVSGLSQGVVSLGTGWNHKYKELFYSYDFIEGLIDLEDDMCSINEKLNYILNEDSRLAYEKKILNSSENEKNKSLKMWSEIFNNI